MQATARPPLDTGQLSAGAPRCRPPPTLRSSDPSDPILVSRRLVADCSSSYPALQCHVNEATIRAAPRFRWTAAAQQFFWRGGRSPTAAGRLEVRRRGQSRRADGASPQRGPRPLSTRENDDLSADPAWLLSTKNDDLSADPAGRFTAASPRCADTDDAAAAGATRLAHVRQMNALLGKTEDAREDMLRWHPPQDAQRPATSTPTRGARRGDPRIPGFRRRRWHSPATGA